MLQPLTTETVQRFVGGQFQYQNGETGLYYLGQIASASVERPGEQAAVLMLELDWIAESEVGTYFTP